MLTSMTPQLPWPLQLNSSDVSAVMDQLRPSLLDPGVSGGVLSEGGKTVAVESLVLPPTYVGHKYIRGHMYIRVHKDGCPRHQDLAKPPKHQRCTAKLLLYFYFLKNIYFYLFGCARSELSFSESSILVTAPGIF